MICRLLQAIAIVALVAGPADAGIVTTVHNLAASGPGSIRAPGVGDVCGFCHTPHRASQTRALWNRDLPPTTYKLYESTTLQASPSQPTGASRLCLSCHDGTTALASVRVRPRTGRITLGPLTGPASLGTDLSDDHPISFVYDTALALRRGELVDPSMLPGQLRLDAGGQLQCTTCHDPHENRTRDFLRMDDRSAALCTACHRMQNWSDSTHATSAATWRGTGANPWPTTPYTTVSDNGCENCHRPHSAPHPERLLGQAQEADVCLSCHNGSVASKDVEAELLKPSAHPVLATDWIHDPLEDPRTMPSHVTCVDCHNPHQVTGTTAPAPGVPGALRGVRGLDIGGAPVPSVRQGYEVCLECHGVRDETTPGLVRQDNTRNIRLQISPSNPSYHPIVTAGRNPSVSGFEAGYTSATIIACTDCHNNDAASPTAPAGPHGSIYAPILERNYQTTDPVSEAYQTYAMCYKCHNRTALLSDSGQAFPHREHVVDAGAPCAACHDAHGSRQNPALIDFMLRDPTGKTVVAPSATQHRLEYDSTGPGRGQCYLTCHGENHEPHSYP